jgi:exodeoxyribonuclease-5
MSHDWSPQQEAALKAIEAWFDDPKSPQIFRMFGFAGTGKTTLAKEIRALIKDKPVTEEGRSKVLYGAFTGKAALVLQSKGCRGASTIHSLIYTLDEESGGIPRFILNDESLLTKARLCIIDECSMVGAELARDLMSFGVKILVIGDPAQLPPVQDAGFFTNAEPDVMLTEVHRQARDNPIIRMSMEIRAGKRLEFGDFGQCKVIERKGIDPNVILGADQVLVGMNKTRFAYNARIRELKGYTTKTPVAGEKLVCLRNNRTKNLLNGGIWMVKKLRKENEAAWRGILSPEDAGSVAIDADVKVHPFFFAGREGELPWEERKEFDEFTFGYALTVHKSQGSQWPNVVLFDESGAFRNDRSRWLYTGVTRAAETLTVVM